MNLEILRSLAMVLNKADQDSKELAFNRLLVLSDKLRDEAVALAESKKANRKKALESNTRKKSIMEMVGRRSSGHFTGEKIRTDIIYPAQDWNQEDHIYARYAREQAALMELKC